MAQIVIKILATGDSVLPPHKVEDQIKYLTKSSKDKGATHLLGSIKVDVDDFICIVHEGKEFHCLLQVTLHIIHLVFTPG